MKARVLFQKYCAGKGILKRSKKFKAISWIPALYIDVNLIYHCGV